MPARLVPSLAAAAALCLAPALANAVPTTTIHRGLIKIGIDKVISVTLASEQPPGEKQRVVVLRLASSYPECADAEPFHFAEGDLDNIKYISFWAPTADPCPGGGTIDLEFPMTLDVAKPHSFVFRGPGKFDRRVSFRVEKDKIASLLEKKIIAH